MEVIILLAILMIVFLVGIYITGALLSAMIWFFVKLPLALFVGCLGIVLCLTIFLIPLGIWCLQFALDILT